MRVLHCPYNITGNPFYLAQAERELGLQSRAVTFTEHAFRYPIDEVLLRPGQSKDALELSRWRLLWRAIRDFDVIHFNFGCTIMPGPRDEIPKGYNPLIRLIYNSYARLFHLADLPLLKRLGKGIFITYHGDDARQGDYSLAHFDITFAREVDSAFFNAASDAQKRRDIAFVARYVDRIYALNPDLLHVLPGGEYMPTASVDPRTWQPVFPSSNDTNKPFTILHAPSNRAVKGTKYVLEAVERLRAEGLSLELLLIENVSHAEARRAYEKADLLVDQLLAGWYGVLAVELMALGKPVICYIRQEDLVFLPTEMRAELPIINATPFNITETLRKWVTTSREELAEKGRQGRKYVEHWHDPIRIATRLKSDYENARRAK